MTNIDKYFNLIDCRMQNIPNAEYTEKHHIVPKSICPIMADVKSNLVSLTAYEHFMAHYYLWKYSREECHNLVWERKMFCALVKMYKQTTVNMTDAEAEVAAKHFEEVRTKCCLRGKNNPMYGKNWQDYTDELTIESQKKKISAWAKKWHAENINPMLGKHQSDKAKAQISAAMRKLKWWNNGTEQVRAVICPDGFVHGRLGLSDQHKEKIRLNAVHRFGKDNPMYGRKMSEDFREKCRARRIGRKWFNNGEINVFVYACPEGFVHGRIKKHK